MRGGGHFEKNNVLIYLLGFCRFVSLLIFAWSVINYPLYESIIIIVFYIWLILVPLYLIVYEWLIDCH
ncbi:Uncharacterised protein [Salmonella enterica subsp. enterica]|uniref:Uncharacterized protein n=1 Tax=Salmonella enterica I TaxID=59201 RepID=A0A379WVX5_SALET|nr:Uncharacterised protein [Salmonella enterica subsp. enterica]